MENAFGKKKIAKKIKPEEKYYTWGTLTLGTKIITKIEVKYS